MTGGSMKRALRRLSKAVPFSVSQRLRGGDAPVQQAKAWSLPLPAGTHVGLAQVLSVQPDGRPRLRLMTGAAEVVAHWALPYRYVPELGDLLRVIGKDGRFYVLGVAQGRGRSLLWFPGDLALRAHGRLRLAADRGVRLVSKRLTVKAETLETHAHALHELTTTAARTARGLSHLVAGQVRRVTVGEDSVLAKRITILGVKSVKLDGRFVRTG